MFTSAERAQRDGAERAQAQPTDPDYAGPERRRSAPAGFDPVYVGRFAWRWRWFVAATTALGLGLGALVAATTPKTYLSAATVLVDPRDLKVVQNEVAPNALPSDATLALIESQTAVATSDRVLAQVIEKTGLADDPDFNGDRQTGFASLLPFAAPAALSPPERRAHLNEVLQKAVSVTREPKSFIVHLAVKTFDPEKSARIANVLAATFIDEIGRIQSDTARRATQGLSSRLSELRRSVVEAEGRVEDYKTRNALIGVGGRLVDDAYITRINDQLARTRADIAALRVKAQSLRNAGVEDVVSGGLPEEAGAEALSRLRQSYADLAQQAASLAAQLGPRHPRRIAIESALATARESIRRELARIVSAGQTELARAKATEVDLASQIDELKSRQVQTSGAFVKLRELEREVEASRAVYEAFLLRARETSEQESLNTANIRVISDAAPPIRPFGPSRKLIAAAGGIGGLVAGLGLLVAAAMLRLVIGFLRQDRRASGRRTWSAAERASHAARATPAPGESPVAALPRGAPASLPASSAMAAEPAPRAVDHASEPAAERALLREKLRLLGANASARSNGRGPGADRIEGELDAIRGALAGIRQRRLHAGPAAPGISGPLAETARSRA